MAQAHAEADGLCGRILDGRLQLLRKLGSYGISRRMGCWGLNDADCSGPGSR